MKKIITTILVAILTMVAGLTLIACGGEQTQSATAPGAVASFAATAGDDGKVTLTWTAPSNNGGSEVTKYQITKDNWTSTTEKDATTFTHTFGDLVSGVEITVKIRAVNSKGAGTESSKTVTPVASPFTFTLIDGDTAYSVAASANTAGAITIPSTHQGKPVTTIADNGFRSSAQLTSITIPASITKIPENAFRDCTNLTEVNLNATIDHIYQYSFSGCSKLTSIVIPEGVDSIGTSAFSGCSKLANVTLPSTLESIGNSAFNYCRALTSINLPDSLTIIGSSAFYVCDGLTSIIIPQGTTTIKSAAFSGCDKLMEIVIPSTIATIEATAFFNVPNAAKVFYSGTAMFWNILNNSIGGSNGPLKVSTSIYYLSETSQAGNYWHMVDGKPVVWVQA